MHGKVDRPWPCIKAIPAAGSGALDAVYRRRVWRDTWQRLSNSSDIKNIESIAIDSQGSKHIYAGTWHLAWKTSTPAPTGAH